MDFTLESHMFHSKNTCAQKLLHWLDNPALGRKIRPTQPICTGLGRMIRPLRPKLSVHFWMFRFYPGWSGPGTFWIYFLVKIKGFCEWDRMIRTYAGWSEPGSFRVCFSLFCHPPEWSECTPDDPELTENTHNGHLRGWGYKYPFTPLFYLSLLFRPSQLQKLSFPHSPPSKS